MAFLRTWKRRVSSLCSRREMLFEGKRKFGKDRLGDFLIKISHNQMFFFLGLCKKFHYFVTCNMVFPVQHKKSLA